MGPRVRGLKYFNLLIERIDGRAEGVSDRAMVKGKPIKVWKGREAINLYPVCGPAERTTGFPRKASERKRAPSKIFALPEKRAYPIHDSYHATLALAHLLRTAGRHGPQPEAARRVLAAVRRHWPGVYGCEQAMVARIKRAHGLR